MMLYIMARERRLAEHAAQWLDVHDWVFVDYRLPDHALRGIRNPHVLVFGPYPATTHHTALWFEAHDRIKALGARIMHMDDRL